MRYFFELVRLENLKTRRRPVEEVAYELDQANKKGALNHLSDIKVVVSIMDQLERKGSLSEKQEQYLKNTLSYNTIYHQMY